MNDHPIYNWHFVTGLANKDAKRANGLEARWFKLLKILLKIQVLEPFLLRAIVLLHSVQQLYLQQVVRWVAHYSLKRPPIFVSQVSPKRCTVGSQPAGTKCSFSCEPGFVQSGAKSAR